MARKGRN